MPRQEGPPYFTGKINGWIGYKRNGIYFIRKAEVEVRQTAATKQAAKDFSSASSCGKLIRQALHKVMDLQQDEFLAPRLNKLMAKVLREDKVHQTGQKVIKAEHLHLLQGFSFNKETKIDNVLLALQTDITYDEHITIRIASIPKLKYTDSTTHIEIKAIAISPDFAKGTCKQAVSEARKIKASETTLPSMELMVLRPGNQATIVILQVRPLELVNKKYYELEDKKYLAADIITVLPAIPLTLFKKPKQSPKKKGKHRK